MGKGPDREENSPWNGSGPDTEGNSPWKSTYCEENSVSGALTTGSLDHTPASGGLLLK